MAKSVKSTVRATTPLASSSMQTESTGNKPAHSIRYGNVKATIWPNESEDNGTFYSVTLTRSWRDEKQEWHDSQSFNFKDLPHLAKAVNDAHSWIAWQERRNAEAKK